MFRKISYRAQQLVTYCLGSCQVLPPWPEQSRCLMQEEKSSYLSAEWDHGGLGHDATAPLVLMGLLSGRDPARRGAQPGPYTNSLVKPGFTKKARNSSYCLCHTSLTLVKWSKTPCPQLPRLTPPDPPSSGTSSGSDEPTTLHRWAEHRAGSQIASHSELITTADLTLLSPQWITLELPPLDPCAAQLPPALQEFTGRSACAMKTLQRSWNAPAMES